MKTIAYILVTYYGSVKDIIEVDYYGQRSYVCGWRRQMFRQAHCYKENGET